MILDKGVCTIFRKTNAAGPGEMPRPEYAAIFRGWYGELDFETSPQRPTEGREELRTDARIRVFQDRGIRQNDVAVLKDTRSFSDVTDADPVYKITRCYHGEDEDGAGLITDLSLEVFVP